MAATPAKKTSPAGTAGTGGREWKSCPDTRSLTDGQSEAVERLLGFENGILSAPTGFGKTVIGVAVIARLKMPTLAIAPKTALVPQWKERLSEFSGRALRA